uniref:BZIP domain-containing protein n=1 Tax=Megaselia scalaris TaxID=36166 RepID=T1H2I6_MEGSC
MRSPKDQEKRDKNTIACRMSRRLKKLEEVAIEEQYKTFKDQYMANLLETQRIVHYMKELIKLSYPFMSSLPKYVGNITLDT